MCDVEIYFSVESRGLVPENNPLGGEKPGRRICNYLGVIW